MTNRRNLIPYLVIISGTVIIDWILGALCASGIIPSWVYLVANFPFGGLYVWMESSWVGTHYVMLGWNVGDFGSLVIFGITVLGQACVYCILWRWLNKWNHLRHQLITL